jgi:hypothetical protein
MITYDHGRPAFTRQGALRAVTDRDTTSGHKRDAPLNREDPSMPSGSNSASRRSACWPGCASYCWKGNWPPPSRRSSATGYCISPRASPTAAGACACGYQRPGPGDTTWPKLFNASPHCPVPPADQQTPDRPRPERSWRTRPERRAFTMPTGRPATEITDRPPPDQLSHPKRNSEVNHRAGGQSWPTARRTACGRQRPALGADTALMKADRTATVSRLPHGPFSSCSNAQRAEAAGRTGPQIRAVSACRTTEPLRLAG